jgi:hypothetical protein
VDLQGDFQSGRQALIRGNSSEAAARFERVARSEPKYITELAPLRQSI